MERKTCSRKSLSLRDKVDILRDIETGKSHLAVAKEVGVSRQCISQIWAKKTEILSKFGKENPTTKKVRPLKFQQIDSALLKWFTVQRNKNIPISGPMLQEKAKKIALELSVPEFQASDGWLDKWKKRHQITFRVVSGEAASVDLTGVGIK